MIALIKNWVAGHLAARLTEPSSAAGMLGFIELHTHVQLADPMQDAALKVVGSLLALAAVVIKEGAAGHPLMSKIGFAPAPVPDDTVDLNKAELARHQ